MIDGKIETLEKPNSVDIEDIHNEMKAVDYNNFYRNIGGRNAKNYLFEHIHAPEIAYTYYFLFTRDMKIPSVEYLCNIYLSKYFDCSNNKYKLKDCYADIEDCHVYFNRYDIFGRICRAYNSFNREVELLYNLFKYEDFESCYDLRTDVFDGIDISINYNNKLYGIFVYQDSINANKYRSIKSTTRHKFSNLNAVLLPAIFLSHDDKVSNIVDYGDIGVFSKSTVDDVREVIVNGSDKIKIEVY